MTTSWMYDGFPLRRADETTSGSDYKYVIQSLDAAIRHVFGFPTGESLTPAFSIDADGVVEILESLVIGSSVHISEITDEIDISDVSDDDVQLANVAAIRAFVSEYVIDYLTDQDTFVEKAGDTMTGALVANGGITATEDLEITNALFVTDPALDAGVVLTGGEKNLIQYSSGVWVGDNSALLKFSGSQTRPLYGTAQLALLTDITDYITDGAGLDYVPILGGTFIGQVEFTDYINLGAAAGIAVYDTLGDTFVTVISAINDLAGEHVEYLRVDGVTGGLQIELALAIDNDGTYYDIISATGDVLTVGNTALTMNLTGLGTRPQFKGDDLALFDDLGDTYVAGTGIQFNDLGGGVQEIVIEPAGIEASHFVAGDPGEYLRLSPGGLLVWDSLDIVAGTGITIVEDPGTKQIEVGIDDGGVDTDQLAYDAVTADKIDDDAIDYEHIYADRTDPDANPTTQYSLTVTGGTLEWAEGGGSGSLRGTAERLRPWTRYDVVEGGSEGAPDKSWTESNGPYIVEYAAFVLDHSTPRAVSLKIVADGIEVFNATAGPIGVGDPDPYFRGVIVAKETLAISAWTAVNNEGGYLDIWVQRLE